MKKLTVLLSAALLVFGMSTAALAASYNTNYNTPNGGTATQNIKDALAVDDATYDSGAVTKNANDSGIGVGGQTPTPSVIKNVSGQKTHSNYNNNTNSCASCHQTHTGAAKDLLFKSSVYNTCTACHDGTLGYLNVFEGSTAGTFGGNAAGNASMHLATGAVQIAAAPGGDYRKVGIDGEHAWTSKFDCASCHTPHGSYGDRLLHFNPNHMANTIPTEGGLKIVTDTLYGGTDLLPANADNGTVAVVYDAYADIVALGATGPYASKNILFMTGNKGAAITNKTIAVVVEKTAAGWKVETTPWFYEYEFNAAHTGREYSTGFWTVSSAEQTMENAIDKKAQSPNFDVKTITIDHNNGFAYGSFAGIKSAGIGRVYVTKMPIIGYHPDENWYMKTNSYPGMGKSMSKWCGSCHTDYNTASGKLDSMWGSQSAAYRHTTNNDSYMCLRCHFAHGTDVTVMADAMDKKVSDLVAGGMTEAAAKAYMLDKNPSSALKRYTNMASCWKCHTSSHSAGFQNNEYYKNEGKTSTGVTTTIPSGFAR